MRDAIHSILEQAIHAPSGENCQPWEFVARENSVSVYNLPERDNSLYNFRGRGSLVAHGALLENISLIAPTYGLRADIALFPEGEEARLIATVSFSSADTYVSPLVEWIPRRATNRKSYEKTYKLTEKERELIRNSPLSEEGEARLIEDEASRKELARAISLNERIIFENYDLHSFLFSHIRWTRKEEAEKGGGLYIETLELPPPVAGGFRHLFWRWRVLQALNRIGFSKFVALQNAGTYFSSSAIGALILPGSSPLHFLRAGRAIQRMWLRLTSAGLSMQPITGLVYLRERIVSGEPASLTPLHQTLILRSYLLIAHLFKVEDACIGMTFRIGRALPPTASSAHFSPNIL